MKKRKASKLTHLSLHFELFLFLLFLPQAVSDSKPLKALIENQEVRREGGREGGKEERKVQFIQSRMYSPSIPPSLPPSLPRSLPLL